MEDRDALLRHYREMRAALMEMIDGLSDDALTVPSLDGWSVKDHLAHIAFWDDVRAQEVERISAGHASAWRMTGEQEQQVGPVVHALRRDLSLAQVRWELARTHRQLLDAIGSATEDGLDGSRYGEAGLMSRHEAQHTGWVRRWRATLDR